MLRDDVEKDAALDVPPLTDLLLQVSRDEGGALRVDSRVFGLKTAHGVIEVIDEDLIVARAPNGALGPQSVGGIVCPRARTASGIEHRIELIRQRSGKGKRI